MWDFTVKFWKGVLMVLTVAILIGIGIRIAIPLVSLIVDIISVLVEEPIIFIYLFMIGLPFLAARFIPERWLE